MANGWTLDGAGYTLTAIDPSPSVDFTGSVLTNEPVAAGATMHVTDIHVDGSFDSGCSSLLNGVRFSGAAGSFTHSTVSDIKYGAGSGCQSGNSVDINNLGGATRLGVTVDDVHVTGFQKTGIRANGNVALHLTNSSVESSELDLVTASNSLQLSRGARAYVSDNTFGGNDWDGNNQWSASGVLLYGAEDVTFTRNVVNGTDTDLGLFVSQDATYQAGRTTITCNLVERDAAIDAPFDLWSTGIGADEDLLAKVDARGNTVRGFATPYENVTNETSGPCASGPVDDLDVDGATTAVTVTWSAPDAEAYAPVTGYDVTLTPSGATQTVTGTTATFSGLSSATQYTATVTPLNAAGSGTPASASGRTGPGAATITQTTTTDSQVTVGWTVPGTAYTGFDLVLEDVDGPVDSVSVAGDARTWTFTDLAALTDYTITVTPRQGASSGADDSVDVTTNEDTNTPPTAPGPGDGTGPVRYPDVADRVVDGGPWCQRLRGDPAPGRDRHRGHRHQRDLPDRAGQGVHGHRRSAQRRRLGPEPQRQPRHDAARCPDRPQHLRLHHVRQPDLDSAHRAEPGHQLHGDRDAVNRSGGHADRVGVGAHLPGQGLGPDPQHDLHLPRDRDERVRDRAVRGQEDDRRDHQGDDQLRPPWSPARRSRSRAG